MWGWWADVRGGTGSTEQAGCMFLLRGRGPEHPEKISVHAQDSPSPTPTAASSCSGTVANQRIASAPLSVDISSHRHTTQHTTLESRKLTTWQEVKRRVIHKHYCHIITPVKQPSRQELNSWFDFLPLWLKIVWKFHRYCRRMEAGLLTPHDDMPFSIFHWHFLLAVTHGVSSPSAMVAVTPGQTTYLLCLSGIFEARWVCSMSVCTSAQTQQWGGGGVSQGWHTRLDGPCVKKLDRDCRQSKGPTSDNTSVLFCMSDNIAQ